MLSQQGGVGVSIRVGSISDVQSKLREILNKYGVNDVEEIHRLIEEGKVPEHPTFEDYLEAYALKTLIDNTTNRSVRKIDYVKLFCRLDNCPYDGRCIELKEIESQGGDKISVPVWVCPYLVVEHVR